jgi:hypothetical protein
MTAKPLKTAFMASLVDINVRVIVHKTFRGIFDQKDLDTFVNTSEAEVLVYTLELTEDMSPQALEGMGTCFCRPRDSFWYGKCKISSYDLCYPRHANGIFAE